MYTWLEKDNLNDQLYLLYLELCTKPNPDDAVAYEIDMIKR